MLEINCRVTKPNEPSCDVAIKVGDPKRSASVIENHECELRLGDDRSVAIGGVTPLDALINALTVAKIFVAGKSGNIVEWK